MFRIEVKGFSEKAYPRHLVLKAGKIGALRIISLSEIVEGRFDFVIETDDWAVINALHCIPPKMDREGTTIVKMSNVNHPIWMTVNFSIRSAGDGFVKMRLPEWAIANIIIALLTTLELNELFERKIK